MKKAKTVGTGVKDLVIGAALLAVHVLQKYGRGFLAILTGGILIGLVLIMTLQSMEVWLGILLFMLSVTLAVVWFALNGLIPTLERATQKKDVSNGIEIS